MRGVHGCMGLNVCVEKGSSPHARGPPVQVDLDIPLHGIIPACAGSTVCAVPTDTADRDHPRMRGVHEE